MHVGRQQSVDDVGCLSGVEAGIERAGGGEGGDDPGLAVVPLLAYLGQQVGRLGIHLGGGGQHVHDRG